MTENHNLGEQGEALACLFLEMCGYRCLKRRFRIPGAEVDLVMEAGCILVFVEVKTRGKGSPGNPEDYVSQLQISRMRRAARQWLAKEGWQGRRGVRFDVVAVGFGGEGGEVFLRHHLGVDGAGY